MTTRRQTAGDETWNRLLTWTKGKTASERLAAHILAADGFKSIDPSHPMGGRDGLKDFVMRKSNIQWIGAAYFPNGKQDFKAVNAKFDSDLEGIKKNSAKGIAFVTNQELTLGECRKLKEAGKPDSVEVYHLERIASILDRPESYGIRLEYLDIELTKEEQLAFFSKTSGRIDELNDKIEYLMADYKMFVKATQPCKKKSFVKRSNKKIFEALDEMSDRVWYDRHQLLKHRVYGKTEKVAPDIWKGALAAAKAVEIKYGKKNLGPYSDFEWGMVNGKLSALRWILGDEWDMLDT